MPGNYHFSVDRLEEEINELMEIGIKSVILFGVPGEKDEAGSDAYDINGIVQKAVRKIKEINIFNSVSFYPFYLFYFLYKFFIKLD